MAVYDLKDQQEIENFKYFWKKTGRWLFALLLIAALGYLGYTLYQSHQNSHQAKAAHLFDQWVEAERNHQSQRAKQTLASLQSDYPQSIAAAQATLISAGSAFDQKQYSQAEKHLNWVLQYQDAPLIQALATQRLATIQLQQQQYDNALKTLERPVASEYQALIAETRGDVYHAEGKIAEAHQAYQAALEKLPKDAPNRQLLQFKAEQSQTPKS